METTSSTWSFEARSGLFGCGIDSEKIRRFEKLVRSDHAPLPFVFSRREIEHSFGAEDAARSLCISFCVKEAARKALGEPFNYPECEVFPMSGAGASEERLPLHLRDSLKREFGLVEGVAVAFENRLDKGEMVAVVYLLGGGR